MILEMRPLSLAEVKKLAGDLDEKKELKSYLKKFGQVSFSEAEKIAESIRGLGNMKIKEEHVVKIIDFYPKNVSDLNKIFTDVALDEKEANEVLEIIKEN